MLELLVYCFDAVAEEVVPPKYDVFERILNVPLVSEVMFPSVGNVLKTVQCRHEMPANGERIELPVDLVLAFLGTNDLLALIK